MQMAYVRTTFKAKPAVNYPDNLCSCSLSYSQLWSTLFQFSE